MNRLYRSTLQRMLILFRLVIVLSLAGYSVSFASAAMHGKQFSDVVLEVEVQQHDHGAHNTQDSARGSVNVDCSAGGVEQDCCKDFCAGSAIIVVAQALDNRVLLSKRQFLNDQKLTGEVSPIHLPPNI